MTISLQNLAEQRPHLKDPLAFYEKWQRFQRGSEEKLPETGSTLTSDDSLAYPRDNAGSLLQLFASVLGLPAEELDPLCRALESGEIDFMRLPLNEMPELSLPFDSDQLATILFLFSRPFFLTLQGKSHLDGRQWEDGRCPLCSAKPALSSIAEGPRRILHCSWCGTSGSYRFIGCPHCGTGDASRLATLLSEEEPGFRISACDACRAYVKIVDNSVLREMTSDLADLASLPLDIVAQEKGFIRRAPNPIGLKTVG